MTEPSQRFPDHPMKGILPLASPTISNLVRQQLQREIANAVALRIDGRNSYIYPQLCATSSRLEQFCRTPGQKKYQPKLQTLDQPKIIETKNIKSYLSSNMPIDQREPRIGSSSPKYLYYQRID